MNIQATSSVPQPSTSVKTVAIYCRVSTEDQEREGTSLDTQRAACLKYCEEHGYTVTHQFIETWSGLSLERPKLDELRQLIRTNGIGGVVIYCIDRLSRKPVHGVIITEELDKHNISLEAVTEDIDNTELGKLINYIKGYAASLEAEKIRERTMRGTKARVFDKKLPVTKREPFGYEWSGERQLKPNGDYDTVKLILDMAIDGKSYDYIIADLKKKAILSPSGLPDWNKHTISSIIRNPVYAGRFYAFKSEVKAPKQRKNGTYGNSSVKRLPMDQWHYIPEIKIINPPMTWKQRALLLDNLQKRQKLAQRNAKRDYLLRGMVLCSEHTGKGGQPRVFHGRPKRDTFYYCCPVGGCYHAYLPGLELENNVKAMVGLIFCSQPDSLFKFLVDSKERTKTDIEADIKRLEQLRESLINKQAQLEDNYYDKRIEDVVYVRLRAKYRVQAEQYKNQLSDLLMELAQLSRIGETVNSFAEIREKFMKLLLHPEKLTTANWKALFDVLNLRIHVNTPAERDEAIIPIASSDGAVDTDLVEELRKSKKFHFGIDVDLRMGIPLSPLRIGIPLPTTIMKSVNGIVLPSPVPG